MKTLRAGATGDEVFTLQNLLNEWGFVCPPTGVFDENTEKAVRDFQQAQGLTADGIVGKRTWETLQDESQLTNLIAIGNVFISICFIRLISKVFHR